MISELYSKEIQQTSVGRWHIPCADSDSWLCLSDTPIADLRADGKEAAYAGHEKSWYLNKNNYDNEINEIDYNTDDDNEIDYDADGDNENSDIDNRKDRNNNSSSNENRHSNYSRSDIAPTAITSQRSVDVRHDRVRKKRKTPISIIEIAEIDHESNARNRVEKLFIKDRFEKKPINVRTWSNDGRGIKSTYRTDVS